MQPIIAYNSSSTDEGSLRFSSFKLAYQLIPLCTFCLERHIINFHWYNFLSYLVADILIFWFLQLYPICDTIRILGFQLVL